MLQQLSDRFRKAVLSKISSIAKNDATGGIAMLFCTVLALILQNGSYSTSYRHWLDISAGISFGDFSLVKPLLLWINDGLITIFFFSIGLELKIEFIKGHLKTLRSILLPGLAAVGGIIAPSLVFIMFNHNDPFAMQGWAIPTATDTAFSVALLLLLGNRVPASLKIFLLSMAIFDDIGAILVIALFYTSELSVSALVAAGFSIIGLAFLNYLRAGRSLMYLIFGVLLWFAILKSGVHATLAGIITAFFIPMNDHNGREMVEKIFEDLKVWVAVLVLPVFTIANAGIDLSLIDLDAFLSPVSLGIFCGLVFGKQLGIFLVVFLCVKLRLVKMPEDANFRQIYGVCMLTGIGFSMSMFIDTLAYRGSNIFNYADSLAILTASLVSGTTGYLFLRFYACRTKAIAYRPWLPAPAGYGGSTATANIFAMESRQGPSSVAPTAAAVAASKTRIMAADAAAKAAREAAKAAVLAARVARDMAEKPTAEDKDVNLVQKAAAVAAAAAAEAAVSSSILDDDRDSDHGRALASATGAATHAASVAMEVAGAEEGESIADIREEILADRREAAESENAESEEKDNDASESEGTSEENKDESKSEDRSDTADEDVKADAEQSSDDKDLSSESETEEKKADDAEAKADYVVNSAGVAEPSSEAAVAAANADKESDTETEAEEQTDGVSEEVTESAAGDDAKDSEDTQLQPATEKAKGETLVAHADVKPVEGSEDTESDDGDLAEDIVMPSVRKVKAEDQDDGSHAVSDHSTD